MDEAPIILRVLQSIFGLYGAIYLSTAIFAPGWFLDTLSINHLDRRSALRQRRHNVRNPSAPWYSMPLAFLTMLAVGIVVYAAVYAVIAVVPYDWGSHDEDGEWQSLRWSIQYGAGFIGAVALCLRLEKNAEVLVWGPAERKARKLVTEAVQHARGMTRETKESILISIDKKLQPEPHTHSSFENDYSVDLHRWIRGDIKG